MRRGENPVTAPLQLIVLGVLVLGQQYERLQGSRLAGKSPFAQATPQSSQTAPTPAPSTDAFCY